VAGRRASGAGSRRRSQKMAAGGSCPRPHGVHRAGGDSTRGRPAQRGQPVVQC